MTTGCSCATPGCRGIAPERNSACRTCQAAAVTAGSVSAVRELLHRVLYGRDLTAEPGSMWCTEMGMEAGS
jgi:hypothetical protein